MKLNEFIQQTLWEISSGVTAGAIRSRPFAAIAPSTIDGVQVGEKAFIEFDISLLVSDQKSSAKSGGASAGGEITVAPFAKISIGGKGNVEAGESATEQQTHKITFKVPIHFEANFRKEPALSDSERLFATNAISADRSI